MFFLRKNAMRPRIPEEGARFEDGRPLLKTPMGAQEQGIRRDEIGRAREVEECGYPHQVNAWS